MTREEAVEILQGAIKKPNTKDGYLGQALDMAIKALEIVEEFEKAQIITGGRLNGRTYAYKCGLEDGKRKALEPCEDVVSRQALIERINNAEENFKADHMESIASDDGDAFVDGVLSGVFNIREMVAQAPSVTPTRKKGKWIQIANASQGYYCSICGRCVVKDCMEELTTSYPFCHCGAEMEAEKK